MSRTIIAAVAAIILVSAAFGQSDKPQAFDIVDVHSSPPSGLAQARLNASGGVPRGERYELRNATMLDLISRAYNVTADNVAEGPGWLGADRFDIIAKIPANTSTERRSRHVENHACRQVCSQGS
jgi:uncharacterized protein (TIGR03435 family)